MTVKGGSSRIDQTNMIGLRQKILSKRSSSGAKAALLWPLVLYSLIQIASNYYQQQSSTYCSHQDVKTTTTSFVNQVASFEDKLQVESIQKSCSSSNKISFNQPLLTSSSSSSSFYPSDYLFKLLQIFNQLDNGRTIFGGKILTAEASIQYQANEDKGIIILNSTNFNAELIQYKSPFPHIKLIEYYVPYCGFCRRFKPNYTKLAKDIHPWRNVIRPSAIDIGVSNNSPIAHSWSIKTIPTLLIHPPPNHSLAEKMNKSISDPTISPQNASNIIFEEFKNSSADIKVLDVTKYMNQIDLLKSDLINYIKNYVQAYPNQLPIQWPNLKPVTESNLLDLRFAHPRQELFLIIEGPTSDSNQSSSDLNLGLTIVMELSSSVVWKAVRYVRASENRALIDDVIAQQKRASDQQAGQIVKQVELLNNLLDSNEASNNILLVHIDDSHSPKRNEVSFSSFPSVTVVSGMDLVAMEEKSVLNGAIHGGSHISGRAKRSATTSSSSRSNNNSNLERTRRSSEVSLFDKMSTERKIELITKYIKQTYTETSEDRAFVDAINNFDENSKLEETSEYWKKVERLVETRKPVDLVKSNSSQLNDAVDSQTTAYNKPGVMRGLFNLWNSEDKKSKTTSSYESQSSHTPKLCEYEDKLKAIRYILFSEVPRTSTIDKSLVEQQERLNTLVNLVTVIKAYFPFTDSSSIQFIDGVLTYLSKQQSRLSSIKTQELSNSGFDTRAFKQELKRLESENKRLPEIKDWKYCTGYPCALWRLFHTLTAFEYKKLNQIRQPMASVQPTVISSTGLLQSESSNNNLLSPSTEAITMKPVGPLTPVERLVSPPSTTTSLSLTIVAPNSSQIFSDSSKSSSSNSKPLSEADLPMPVLLVMRDYITTFFSCIECAQKFQTETADLSLERIRQLEPAEFSILWLWETHNRVSKRLSVYNDTNPPERPKTWFPCYNTCVPCYKKAPSYLRDTTVDTITMFQESIEWNRQEILAFLLDEYTQQPMDSQMNLFGNQVFYGFRYVIVTCFCCLVLIVVLRCTTYYVERQRRHKATLLNGNGIHYTLELQ